MSCTALRLAAGDSTSSSPTARRDDAVDPDSGEEFGGETEVGVRSWRAGEAALSSLLRSVHGAGERGRGGAMGWGGGEKARATAGLGELGGLLDAGRDDA